MPSSTLRPQMLSVVVPVYDEEAVLSEFHARLAAVLDSLECRSEVLFVDDGSSDGTPEILAELAARDPRVRVLGFTRNFGHQAALCAGLDHCCGDVVVMIDADLQDPPELIRAFLEHWRRGYQVVYGQRLRVEEGALKRFVYHAFYRLLRLLSNIDMPLDTGDFSLVDRSVVAHLRELPERTRFLRGLRSWVGLRQIGLEYRRHARTRGESKYSLGKLFKLAFDGIFSFSTMPLKLALFTGMLASAGGFLGVVVVIWMRLLHQIDLPGWTSLAVIVLFLGGIQLFTAGIMGEYIARIYEEVKRRPLYLVARRTGFPDAPGAGPTTGSSGDRGSEAAPRSCAPAAGATQDDPAA
jgi:dolichol-phosphate mannosyltransferase